LLTILCNSDRASNQVVTQSHRGLWPSGRGKVGRGKVSLSLSPGFEPQRARLSSPRCFTCLLGLQGVQWVRELVVVRVSWPEHPGLPKKKKKSSCTANFILQTISSNYERDGVYLIAWQDPNHVKEYSFWIQNNQIIQWRANLLTICPCMWSHCTSKNV